MRLSRPGAQDDMGQMSLWGVDHRGLGLKRSETLPKCPGSDRHPAASPHLVASVGAAWASVVMGSSLISASQFPILSSGTVTTHHHTATAHLHICHVTTLTGAIAVAARRYAHHPKPRAPSKKTPLRARNPRLRTCSTDAFKASGRPIKGRSAYHFFADEHRMRVWAEHPDMTPGQVGQILGEMWHAQTAAQRTPYERMAEEDRARYEAEVREWQAELERRDAEAR